MRGKLYPYPQEFAGLRAIGKKVANHCLKSNLEG